MKAQIKMFETIAVLVVFMFLIGFGMIMYAYFQQSSAERSSERFAVQHASEVAARAFFMPELDCSFVGIRTPNCFDKLKVQAFGALMHDEKVQRAYFSQFGFSTILVSEIATFTGTSFTDVVLYNLTPNGTRASRASRTPVLLYDPHNATYPTYTFGMMEVITHEE